MTRLEEFADRVTREILRAYWTEPCDDLTLAATNARIVLAREVREFVTGAVDWQAERSAMDPIDEPRAADWLDHTIAAPTPEQRETPDWGPALDRELGQPTATPAPTCRGLVGGGDDALFAAWTGAAQPTATKPCSMCVGSGSDTSRFPIQGCPTCHGEGKVPA